MDETILQQASLQGFIRTVLIIVAIYYGCKILMRLLAPYLMKKVIQKAESNFRQNYEQQFNANHNQQTTHKTHTSSSSSSSRVERPRSTKKVGEYIDYEEID